MQNKNTLNPIQTTFLREVVDTVDSFLFHGARSKFKTIQDAAQGLKSVWEKLVFEPEDYVCNEWQKVGIEKLDLIISGELKGFDAEDHLHGVNGMFNQTKNDAINAVKSAA